MENNNETHNQYREYFKKIKRIIKGIKNKNISDDKKEKKIFNKFYSFLSKFLPEDVELPTIINEISEIIDNNRKFASGIISAFTQDLIDHDKPLSDIGTQIYEIVNTDRIKSDSNLVFNIISGFVKYSLEQYPEYIESVAQAFSNSLNGTEDKIKKKCEPIFLQIVSQHLTNIRNSSSINERLSEEEEKECYNKLFSKINNGKINSFQDISSKYFGFGRKRDVKSEKIIDTGFGRKRDVKSEKIIDIWYYPGEHYYPSANISENKKCITRKTRELSTEADQEKTEGLNTKSNKSSELEQKKYLSSGKQEYNRISNSAKKNNSFTDERHEQQKQQSNRSL